MKEDGGENIADEVHKLFTVIDYVNAKAWLCWIFFLTVRKWFRSLAQITSVEGKNEDTYKKKKKPIINSVQGRVALTFNTVYNN